MPKEKMRLSATVKCAAIGFLILCCIIFMVFLGAAKEGPKTWTVMAGGEAGIEPQENGSAGAWQFMRFYPENITINPGDTIVWKLNSAEPHTVTFPGPGEKPPQLIVPEGNGSQRLIFNPLAVMVQGGQVFNGTRLTGSGQMGQEPQFPKEYNLTFAGPGSFDYFCAFHIMMKGAVVVQPVGTPYPKTQQEIDLEAAEQLAKDKEAALSAVPEASNVTVRMGSNGTMVHEVNMGYGDGYISWMRFIPTNLIIYAGDSVEWMQKDADTPHTVTFVSGGEEPEMVLVEPQEFGPPKLVLNPLVLLPAGGNTYDGQGYCNSGFIWGTKDPLPGPRNYSLVFSKPGSYSYLCVLHDTMGMRGQITVLRK